MVDLLEHQSDDWCSCKLILTRYKHEQYKKHSYIHIISNRIYSNITTKYKRIEMHLVNIKWWQHVLLAFIPSFTQRVNDPNGYYIITKKRLFDQTYIIDIEQAW